MLVKDATQSPQFLDWRDRPEGLQQEVQRAFQDLASSTLSIWSRFNGDTDYNLCGFDTHRLVDRLIIEAPRDKKEFYFLDIGAGNFQWGKSLANRIKELPNLPEDVTFRIISLRGETYDGNPIEVVGPSIIYNIGNFAIERLEEAFKPIQRNVPALSLAGKVDLAVSHYCFRHLADPVGTFVQAYHLIRPEGGLFAFDYFFFEKDASRFSTFIRCNMLTLLNLTNSPFLMDAPADDFKSPLPKSFLLKRVDSSPLRLPFTYNSYKKVDGRTYVIGSNVVTKFEGKIPNPKILFDHLAKVDSYTLAGDRDLFEWLKQKVGFGRFGDTINNCRWLPILEKQEVLEAPEVHRAIREKRLIIEESSQINESDQEGNTPLHIAILENDFPTFQLLLEKGANPLLANANHDLPLHLAAKQPWGAPFLRHLLENGIIPANQKTTKSYTALDDAITAGAQECVDLLRSHGGKTLKELIAEQDSD